MSMNIKKASLPLLVITISVAIAWFINNNEPELKKRTHHKKPVAVNSLVLNKQPWAATINTQGTVEARTMTTLASRVSGEVSWVSEELKPGGFFEKGDLLLKIETIDYELAIKSAEADLAEARFIYQEEQAQSAQALLNWKRLGRTEQANDLVLRKPQLAKARAVVDSGKAKLQRAELDLKRTQIRAPYAGRVLEQYVDIGQFLSSGTALVKLFAIDRVEVRLPLSEKQRAQLNLPSFYRGESIKQHQQLPITISANIAGVNYQWPAYFSRVEGAMNRDTRQQYIVAEINDPYQRNKAGRPPLEIGQFVKAELKGRLNKGIFHIPRSAVHSDNQVMLIDKDKRVQRKNVSVLAEEAGFVIIDKGLNEGDRLCTSYVPFLANNTRVNLLVAEQQGDKPARIASTDHAKGL